MTTQAEHEAAADEILRDFDWTRPHTRERLNRRILAALAVAVEKEREACAKRFDDAYSAARDRGLPTSFAMALGCDSILARAEGDATPGPKPVEYEACCAGAWELAIGGGASCADCGKWLAKKPGTPPKTGEKERG